MATPTAAPQAPAITPGTRAEWIAEWILRQFAHHRHDHGATAILQTELIRLAWEYGIDLLAWINHPHIRRATGIRGVTGGLYEDVGAIFFTLDPEPRS